MSTTEEFEQDEDPGIADQKVMTMYTTAGELVNSVFEATVARLQSEWETLDIVDLAVDNDKALEEAAEGVYSKLKEKGLCMPLCVSINEVIGNFAPLSSDKGKITLKEGDVVKLDCGLHIGGYAVMAATTVVLGATAEEPATGPAADVVMAAYEASIAAMKMLKPGTKNTEITKVIGQIAEAYHVTPVQGVLSHDQSKYQYDGPNVILNRADTDVQADEFEVGADEVYTLDVVMSTGEGESKSKDERVRVYALNIDEKYQLKMKSARKVFSEAQKRFVSMPFPLRVFEDGQSRLGISEMLKHALLIEYPVTEEKKGTLVAQFKFTVLVTSTNTLRISGQKLDAPYVKSEYKVEDEAIVQILNSTTKRKKKKKKKKAASNSE